MSLINLGLAFSAGFMATLAPCALPMLPSYIAYYLNLTEEPDLKKSLGFATATLIGFLTLYTLLGLLPGVVVNRIASSLDLFIPIVGLFLIIIGILSGFSNIIDRFPVLEVKAPERAGLRSFYLYGLGYGAASLSCSFPVFILLVLQSAIAGGAIDVLFIFLAYGVGAACLLVPLTLALSYSKEFLYSRIMEYLPYVKKGNSVILIIAGLYMIYYGLAV
jgi:cytochrome c biogenesis protein CcdA